MQSVLLAFYSFGLKVRTSHHVMFPAHGTVL